jgi:hypothetical protein
MIFAIAQNDPVYGYSAQVRFNNNCILHAGAVPNEEAKDSHQEVGGDEDAQAERQDAAGQGHEPLHVLKRLVLNSRRVLQISLQ